MGILDDDGNAEFVFKGISCAAGPSAVMADVLAGSHPTYVTTYTVCAPAVTLVAGAKTDAATAKKAKSHKHPKKHHRGGSGSGTGAGTGGTPAPMTVDASPNPLIETGLPLTAAPAHLTITKTDNGGGSSITNTVGAANPGNTIEYTITVSNTGSSAANTVHVTDPLSSNPDLNSDSYTATETGNATGFTSSGTGDIDDTVNLPAHSSITYTVDAEIGCDVYCGGPNLSNTASAAFSGSTATATDSDVVGTNDC